MDVRGDAEVPGNRKEHEGVLGRESPLVHQQFSRLFAGLLQRVIDVVRRRSVRIKGVGRLGNGPATALVLDDLDLDEGRAADLDARAANLTVAH